MSSCAKLTSRCIIRGRSGSDDATDMGALYTPIHTYLSCLYVIIQLNGQRRVAHVARDRRTVFAREALLHISLSLSLRLSLAIPLYEKDVPTISGIGGRSAAAIAAPGSILVKPVAYVAPT